MKKIALISLIFIGFLLPNFRQLNTGHSELRPSDLLIKQQIEFIASGIPDINHLSDFSKVKTVNNQHTPRYDQFSLLNNSIYTTDYNYFLIDKIHENDGLFVATSKQLCTAYSHQCSIC